LIKFTAIDITDAFFFRRFKVNVINRTTSSANAPSGDTPHGFFITQIDKWRQTDSTITGSHFAKRLRLNQVTGEPIQNCPIRRIWLLKPVLHHTDGHFIGDKITAVNITFRQQP
jgi:hypothetical protein